jgi:hypothetical protein
MQITLSAGDVTEEFYLTLTNGVTEQQLKNITVCPTATTTYTLTVKEDANGCVSPQKKR